MGYFYFFKFATLFGPLGTPLLLPCPPSVWPSRIHPSTQFQFAFALISFDARTRAAALEKKRERSRWLFFTPREVQCFSLYFRKFTWQII